MPSPQAKGVSRGPVELRTLTLGSHVSQLGYTDQQALTRFLDPKLSDLTSPVLMKDRVVAAERLARAIRAQERIVVFGDYDCDGMTATAILSDVLRELGAVVSPLLASRFDGGYGVSERALVRINSVEPQLVVTCDCGSSDHATLRQLTSRGVDVIVIDHHLVPDEPLPVLAFLNPHRPECGFAYKGLASCGLALSVAAELRKQLKVDLDIRRWLDLVAIGTIADVAPLDGDNRILVRAGLQKLQEGARPGLRALMDLIGIDRTYPITAADIGFRIAPRLNAPGRLQAPDRAFELLVERDPARADQIAHEVEHLCQKRRTEQATILEQAESDLKALSRASNAPIVVGREGWNHGIVGIVAGRLADQHQAPTVVIGFEGETGRGSVRGPAGFPLFDAISESSAHLVRFGGHQAAAGLEIEWTKLEAFRVAFAQACAKRSNYEAPKTSEALHVHPGDQLKELLSDLYLLEPTGEANAPVRFAFECNVRACREVRGGHLKLELELDSGERVGGFGPGLFEKTREFKGRAEVIGQLRPDTYRGGGAVELLVSAVKPVDL